MAPSAYLSSTVETSDLVSALLPSSHHLSQRSPLSDAAFEKWSEGHNHDAPVGADAKREKNWDGIVTGVTASSLLEGAGGEVERARLLAAMDRDSGAWLQALPILSVALRLDDSSLKIALGHCLSTNICAPHVRQHCGSEVSACGTHGLSC